MADAPNTVQVDVVEQPTYPSGSGTRRTSRRMALLALLVAVVLGALLVLPQGEAPPRQSLSAGERPAPSDSRLLPWPGRGPWALDERFVAQAVSTWREEAASDPVLLAPGDDVVALWAGPVSGARMALLQTLGPDGAVHVAQVADVLRGQLQPELRVLETSRVESEPEFLGFAFAGLGDRGSQFDPDALATFQVLPGPFVRSGDRRLLRLDGGRFVPVRTRPDGLSEPWAYGRWWTRQPAEMAVVAVDPVVALRTVVLLDPDSLVPAPSPFDLVAPSWGDGEPYQPADYVAAAASLESIGSSSGEAAVLASAVTSRGRASLVQMRAPWRSEHSLVVAVADGAAIVVSLERPFTPGSKAAVGAAQMPDGELVVIAAGAPGTTNLVVFAEGDAIAIGDQVASTVMEPDEGARTVAVQAYEGDTTLARVTADISDSESSSATSTD